MPDLLYTLPGGNILSFARHSGNGALPFAFSVFAPDGTILTDDALISTTAQDTPQLNDYLAGLCYLANGNFRVFFMENEASTGAIERHFYYRDFTPTGAAAGALVPYDSPMGMVGAEDFFTPGPTGTWALNTGQVIVLFDETGAFTNYSLVVNNYDWGANVLDTGSGYFWATNYTDPTGLPGFLGRAVGQFFDYSGHAVGAPIDLLDAHHYAVVGAGNGLQSIDTAMLGDGRLIVVISDIADQDPQDAGQGVWATILNADGSVDRAPFLINTGDTQDLQYNPEVFALADGGFAVAYMSILTAPRTVTLSVRSFDAHGVLRQTFTHVGGSYDTDFSQHVWVSDHGEVFLMDTSGALNLGTFNLGAIPTGPTEGADTLIGTNGPDTLDGLGGDDLIQGRDGADRLIGGTGNDTILGGETAADLRDVIYGGDGDDSIDGGYGNDDLRGDGGSDTIEGGFGSDTLIGGTGNDRLSGSALGDLLMGGEGNDYLNGGFGFDRENGGAGADRFFHLGVLGHGTDWIADYHSAESDRLVFGVSTATAANFQINWATTAGAGDGAVQEAFIVYRPTGQILWALVDGAANDHIWVQAGANSFDLLA